MRPPRHTSLARPPDPATAHGADRVGTGVAHAKVLLFGEHFVLHGQPALALPVRSLRATATAAWTDAAAAHAAPAEPMATAIAAACAHLGLDPRRVGVEIESAVPAARGLGSSAATAVAVVRAIAALARVELDDATLHRLVQQAETVAHGRSSGVDARAAAAAVPLWFQNGVVRAAGVHACDAAPVLLIADSGIPGDTGTAVAAADRRLSGLGSDARPLIERAGSIATAAAADLATGRFENLGAKMTDTHALLATLDVSSAELDNLVSAALRAGALGAKLTGGGRGGCILALTHPRQTPAVTEALRSAGAHGVIPLPLAGDPA